MIYRKLRKLEEQVRDLQSLIIAAYASKADPDVVMIRVNDLQYDIIKLQKEISEEKIFIGFKWGLVAFIAFSIVMIIVTLFKNLL
jgi:hypothetical protein